MQVTSGQVTCSQDKCKAGFENTAEKRLESLANGWGLVNYGRSWLCPEHNREHYKK